MNIEAILFWEGDTADLLLIAPWMASTCWAKGEWEDE